MKNRKIIAAVVLLLMAGIILGVVLGTAPKFRGEKIKEADRYLLSIQQMNDTDEHSLRLSEGDELLVSIAVAKGTISLEIGMTGERTIYRGSDLTEGSFSVIVPQDGEYRIFVEGHHAAGELQVLRKGADAA